MFFASLDQVLRSVTTVLSKRINQEANGIELLNCKNNSKISNQNLAT